MIKHIPTDIDQYEARKEQEKYSRAEQIKREIEAHRSEIKNLENKIRILLKDFFLVYKCNIYYN